VHGASGRVVLHCAVVVLTSTCGHGGEEEVELGRGGGGGTVAEEALYIGTGSECYHLMYTKTYDTRDSTVVPLRSTKHA
jgi:hypothetical protein